MSGLVVFLHGYRGDETDWGTVPSMVERSLQNFGVAVHSYSAQTFSRADIGRSAARVLMEIQTQYAGRDPIYLVGYSMGSIIAREVCRKLLASDPADDALLDRIAAVLTVAAPLGVTRFPRLTRFAGHFSVKVGRVARWPRHREQILGLMSQGKLGDGWRRAFEVLD